MPDNRSLTGETGAASVAVIVLAAGFGSRFGDGDKLGALLAGKPVAHHILSTLQSFDWARKILVCRSNAGWAEAFQNDGFSIVHNDDAGQGMLGSLRAGVLAAGDRLRTLICLADMPLVSGEHILRLLSVAEQEDDWVIASTADTYRGPPAIFPVGALMQLPSRGEGGARSLLTNALFVDCDIAQLMDIDTQPDLQIAESRLPPVSG